MDADKLSFLDDEPDLGEAEAVAPEPVAEAAGQAPDPAPAPADVEGKGEQEAAPPAASEEVKPGLVPLSALMDERDKGRRWKQEAEELRRWKQQQEAQSQPKPDFFDNPDAAIGNLQQQFRAQIVSEKLQQSRFFAERDYGAELVREAYAYFDQNPQQSHALLNEPSPFHAAVEFYKRQKALLEIGPDPDSWRQKQAETLRAQIRSEIEAEFAQKATPTKPAAPPRSLASAPSAGGNNTITPGSAFDQLFG